jgi:hypothetical protein
MDQNTNIEHPIILKHPYQIDWQQQPADQSKNPPHIERLLNILRSSSQKKLPLQIKKSLEYNPVLGRYLDQKRDEEMLGMERKAS